MKRIFVVLLAVFSTCFALMAFAGDSRQERLIRESTVMQEDELEQERAELLKDKLGCIGADRVENGYTPLDLYKAASTCVNSSKYQEGVFLFAFAGVYGYFDSLRVVDKTAHQAGLAIQMGIMGRLDEDKQAVFRENLLAIVNDPERLAVLCNGIRQIGPPDYFPSYMVSHGFKGSLSDDGGGHLVRDFDPSAAFNKSLESYLRCPSL